MRRILKDLPRISSMINPHKQKEISVKKVKLLALVAASAMLASTAIAVPAPQEAFVAALATDADIEQIKAARKAGQ
jgi:Tfp pilus assembly ATPase PilU